ncbi:hypothetical protein V1508DRAFT_432788 [Lipomyces doorenjongii]|uniref:uncharacterized protein n=1 Tax=Lipomyces doorenjongii TaxID=383834 RepID=UPI0034CF8686
MAPKDRQVPTFRISGPSYASVAAQAATVTTPLRAASTLMPVATREPGRLAEIDLLEDTGRDLDSEPDLPTVAEIAAAATTARGTAVTTPLSASSSASSATSSSASLAVSPAPSVAETPAPRSRVFYTEDHKLAIIKLCDLYPGEYTPGNRTRFFQMIANLFNEDHDMNSPTVRALVVNMLKKRRQEQQEKSGVAEADTDLKQALDSFLIRFDTVNAEVIGSNSDEKQTVEAWKEGQEVTRVVRDKMMGSKKRLLKERQTDGSDMEEVTSHGGHKRARSRSRRSEGPISIDIGLGSATRHMASVFERSIDKLIAAPIVLPDNERNSKIDEKVEGLEHDVQELKDDVKSILNILLERRGN